MRRPNPFIALLAVTFTGLGMGSVLAAEEIVFRWQAASRSILLSDLETYATTGEPSQQLQSYFDLFSDPNRLNAVRPILNQTMQVDFVPFERYLRSDAGDCMLDHMATLLKPTPDSTAGKISLRAALINAAAPDGDFNLLEIVTEYPTAQIHLDLDQMFQDNDHDQTIEDDLEEFWQKAGLPQEQLQQLETQIFSDDGASNQPPLNLMDIDYTVLSDVSLRICEKLGRPTT